MFSRVFLKKSTRGQTSTNQKAARKKGLANTFFFFFTVSAANKVCKYFYCSELHLSSIRSLLAITLTDTVILSMLPQYSQ